MKDSQESKVIRWKLAIQRFDCWFEHITGKFNKVADPLSRLVRDVRESDKATLAMMRVAHLFRKTTLTQTPQLSSPQVTRATLASVMTKTALPEERRAIIATAHNEVMGHHGVKRTRDLLQSKKLQWPGMNTHIRQFISECAYCQKASFKTPPVHTQPYTVSSLHPMSVRAVDKMGPFPEDDEGYNGIISIICPMSRFVCLFACKNDTAQHCVDVALMPHFGMFGAPEHIISDNGGQFVADIIEKFMAAIGTMQWPITPYSHEENSLVERYHGEVLRHLRALCYARLHSKHWRRYLPLVQRIINNMYLPAIGCSPTQMLFGNAINTNKGLFLEFSKKEQQQMNLGEYLQDMLREQAAIIKKAQELLKKHEEEHSTSAENAPDNFPDNSYVLVKYPPGPNRSSKPPTKLHTNLKGPYKILRHENDAYWLFDLVTNKERKRPIHITRLIPFRYNPKYTNPKDVARRDHEEFVVGEILNHRFNTDANGIRRKNCMEFLVRWLGYGPEWDSWEPWKNLTAVKATHRYLAKKGMERFIPPQYRREDYDILTDSEDEEDDPLQVDEDNL
jgi:hypothetical protein